MSLNGVKQRWMIEADPSRGIRIGVYLCHSPRDAFRWPATLFPSTMSLSSTATLKAQLVKNLGPKGPLYFEALNSFVSGKSSRAEFEEVAKQVLNNSTLGSSLIAC